jgi:hypothetical protein
VRLSGNFGEVRLGRDLFGATCIGQNLFSAGRLGGFRGWLKHHPCQQHGVLLFA